MPGDAAALAEIYCATRTRIVGLLDGPDPTLWNRPVPACPGWSVRDVVAHLTAVAEDWADGRLAGPPTDAVTAEQIRRFDDHDEDQLLDLWAGGADRLTHLAETTGLQPPLGDIACHEHDIRSAVGKPGARDAPSVRWTVEQLLAMLDPPVPLRIEVCDLPAGTEYRSGPADGAEITLRTTQFEALRWGTGRRSRAQMAAMDWSADPAPVLEHLFLFGPAADDVIE